MMRINKTLPMIWCASTTSLLIICFIGLAASQDRRASPNGEGSYFPLSVGNRWVYNIGGHSKWAGKTQTWTVTDKAIYKGNPEYVPSPRPALGWDSPVEVSPVNGGIVETGERFILKYPIRIGNRWSSKSQLYGAEGKLDEFEVISAGKPCLAGNRSFDDCVTIRETDQAISLFSLTTYARCVGPVKYVYFKDVRFKQIDWTMTIESWEVH